MSSHIAIRETAPSQILSRPSVAGRLTAVRFAFWTFGVSLALLHIWIFRYQVSSDSISYLDMSDGVLHGGDWHRLINGVWNPLYPLLLGVFRRVFHVLPGNEIAVCHLLNIVIFIAAFACFELFLRAATRELGAFDREDQSFVPLPEWAFQAIGYSLFLWAAIVEITVGNLRADMLMSAFLYLAAGLFLRMHRRPARWSSYLALGAVLGIAFLSKEAMLPIGVLILAASLLMVENWRPARWMAASALAVLFLIGSPYFVPLSLQQGHFTLGEAGRLNYVVHVDQASPHWYLQNPGSAAGTLLHPPQKIFSDPPAYAFPVPVAVTHPLRYDLLYWIAGLRPHFVWSRQLAAVKASLASLKEPVRELRVVAGVVFALAFLCGRTRVLAALKNTWPVWLIGLAGCLMYLLVYVEPRYVAAFFTLFFLGLLIGLPVPRENASRITLLIVVATLTALLYPMLIGTYRSFARRPGLNADFQAAQSLKSLGIQPQDRVARISPIVFDYAAERLLRVQIVAEVDRDHTAEFWERPLAVQQDLLNRFAALGARAVIATSPKLTAENRLLWTRLGSTQYWVWRPAIP